ncbi:unnamed protein product [Dovyalis caffra]|uniref:Uncharacterized protein n=1 Tax=Dovyalis caffra TaxID=77055 RepID=A0AAV1QVP7_9ROSI|nr:unnamed protein product [Dovyalis caffra]
MTSLREGDPVWHFSEAIEDKSESMRTSHFMKTHLIFFSGTQNILEILRNVLEKVNDNHINKDCFEGKSLEPLDGITYKFFSFFSCPTYSGISPNIKQFLKILHFLNFCQVFIIDVEYKSKDKSSNRKTHDIRTSTHNVFMDSISLSSGKEDPLPVKSLILLQVHKAEKQSVSEGGYVGKDFREWTRQSIPHNRAA